MSFEQQQQLLLDQWHIPWTRPVNETSRNNINKKKVGKDNEKKNFSVNCSTCLKNTPVMNQKLERSVVQCWRAEKALFKEFRRAKFNWKVYLNNFNFNWTFQLVTRFLPIRYAELILDDLLLVTKVLRPFVWTEARHDEQCEGHWKHLMS